MLEVKQVRQKAGLVEQEYSLEINLKVKVYPNGSKVK